MKVSKVIPFHLPLVIPNEQLMWTKHALERMDERKIHLPPKRAKWQLVEKRKHFEKCTWSLRLKRRGLQDLIIVVEKQDRYKFVVITCFWEDQLKYNQEELSA